MGKLFSFSCFVCSNSASVSDSVISRKMMIYLLSFCHIGQLKVRNND